MDETRVVEVFGRDAQGEWQYASGYLIGGGSSSPAHMGSWPQGMFPRKSSVQSTDTRILGSLKDRSSGIGTTMPIAE